MIMTCLSLFYDVNDSSTKMTHAERVCTGNFQIIGFIEFYLIDDQTSSLDRYQLQFV